MFFCPNRPLTSTILPTPFISTLHALREGASLHTDNCFVEGLDKMFPFTCSQGTPADASQKLLLPIPFACSEIAGRIACLTLWPPSSFLPRSSLEVINCGETGPVPFFSGPASISKLNVDLVLPWIDICCSPELSLEGDAVRLVRCLVAEATRVAPFRHLLT